MGAPISVRFIQRQQTRRRIITLIAASSLAGGCHSKSSTSTQQVTMTDTVTNSPVIYPLVVDSLSGEPTPLSNYQGKVLLLVNTASECGFTPQYKGLETLHEKFAARGFAVLGFPSNDFGGQEPGSADEIATFCSNTYGVTFPMFEKVQVKGAEAAPLYALLTEALGAPKWNFHKYLVDKTGKPVQAFPSNVEPLSQDIESAIERELAR
jgi:glutathione peroxidase